ncbi:alpha/beta fold hydrolase [Streptomyces sp. NBC_01477]|uniref:alpha/beta fold hydrolase n=1 Tax=Streptomyces sp. NBC_01477 TaxID=2976015 RepID=UPI002E372EA5|nr:alpha/beta hydrolase [Streptomyces sp. NBC_01477]
MNDGRPRLVFVHGIGPAQDPAEQLAAWREALARGADAAGHGASAAALRAGGTFDLAFASYADLWQRPGAQGGETADDHLTEADAEIVLALIDELTADRLPDAQDPQERELLAEVRALLHPDGTPQAVGSVLRHSLNVLTTLLEWRRLRRPAQWAGAAVMRGHLAQVSRYLRRAEAAQPGQPTIDARVRNRVGAALGTGPVVVVAHSLGSVVALETLAGHPGPVKLFVTIGSPIGMRGIVWPRIVPQPPRTPPTVERWLNFWDRDDLIVSRHQLTEVRPNARGVVPVSRRIDSDGAVVHSAVKYLAEPAVAGPVMEALATRAADSGA